MVKRQKGPIPRDTIERLGHDRRVRLAVRRYWAGTGRLIPWVGGLRTGRVAYRSWMSSHFVLVVVTGEPFAAAAEFTC